MKLITVYFETNAYLVELNPDPISVLNQTALISNNLKTKTIVNLSLPKIDNSQIRALEPGTTTLIPVWIRADQVGKHVLRFLFVYQSTDLRDKGNYRMLRVTKTIDVSASMRVNAFIRPSLSCLNDFILGVEVTNIRSSYDVIFRQITSISPFWRISLIENGYLML